MFFTQLIFIAFLGFTPSGHAEQLAPTFHEFLKMEKESKNITVPDLLNCTTQECNLMRTEFRYIVYVGKKVYCYWDEKRKETGTDFEKLATDLENSITDKTSRTQYYLTLRQWAASFHDGHVNFLLGEKTQDFELYTAPIRLELLSADTDHETVVVVESKKSEVQVGDVVTSVNGKPVGEAITALESRVSGSTRRMRRYSATRFLVDAIGKENGTKTLKLVLERGEEKKEVSAELFRNVSLYPTVKESPATSGIENFKAVQVLPGEIGYLRLDAFSGTESSSLLDQAMARLYTTQALILDMRKNGGGDQSGNRILSRLTEKDIVRYRVSPRKSDFALIETSIRDLMEMKWIPGTEFLEWSNLTVNPEKIYSYVGKPVYTLIGTYCFSACDTFVSALKTNHLSTLIGTPTGGGTGSPYVFDLDFSKNHFRYSQVRGLTATNQTIEGVGTFPDVLAEETAKDRAKSIDSQLLVAIDLIQKKLGQEQSVGPKILDSLQEMEPIWIQGIEISPTLSDDARLRSLPIE